ncbi:paramyosin-like [Nasonia vitripennis]|uniref:Uncharacterized protein n=1 Tax=Nasonia vitripennis TaxID=7425 RepID=A0A7M7LQV8_NASVI|nr:paramyosin-like [Nasonia vitripennis]
MDVEEEDEEDEEEEEVSTCAGPCYEEELSSQSTADQEQPRGRNYCCCCCHYDPFEEEEEQDDDSRIRDPSFALRKLKVMKCQMRKWRLERPQLESRVRSLSLALQALGGDAQEVLAKTDPLAAHYREESQRLELRKDQLEDEVRDLRETLAERDCCEEQPCDAVAHVREKIWAVRLRAAEEKRELRRAISDLRQKLEEAREDSSCSALNRLRGKLRELTRDGEKAAGGDQHAMRLSSAALEKSIETMAELTTSCDQLKRENERLLAEVEGLKKEIKADTADEEKFVKEDDLEASAAEISELANRVRSCESTATQMRLQLAEKDETINELQKKLYAERRGSQQLERDLERTLVSQRGFVAESDAMKAELADKDQKVSQLQRDLRQSVVATQALTDLESELERLRPELRELETQRDEMLVELSELRRELSSRNDQIDQLLEERDRQRTTFENELEKVVSESRNAQDKHDQLVQENEALRERVNQLENELETRRRELEAAMQQHRSEISDLRGELANSRSENESLRATTNELRQADQERRSLADKNAELLDKLNRASADVDRLTASLDELQKSSGSEAAASRQKTTELKEALEKQNIVVTKLGREKEELSATLKNLENDSRKLQEERDALQRSLRELEEKLAESKRGNEASQREIEELANRANEAKEALEKASGELRQAKGDGQSTKRQLDESRKELENSRADVDDLRKAKDELKSRLDASEALAVKLRAEVDSLSSENADLTAERDRLRADRVRLSDELEHSENRLVELQEALANTAANKDRLERELGDLKWQLDKLRKDLNAELIVRKESQDKLETANAEIERLKSRIAELEASQASLSAELNNLRNELALLATENGQFKSEAERLRSETGKARRQSAHLRSELSKLQSAGSASSAVREPIDGPSKSRDDAPKPKKEESKPRKDAAPKPKDEQRRSRARAEQADKSPLDNGFDPKASEALRSEMQSQIEGVNRVRGFISYVEGKAAAKPPMTTTAELPRRDKTDWQSSPRVGELFESSRKLSEAILKAELEIQRLEKASNPAIDEPRTVADETPVDKQLAGQLSDKPMEGDGEAPEEATSSDFDADAWLQSLTLTELAELHGRICLLTSNMIQDDEGRDLLDARMAALQRQIAEKQLEATTRAEEMQRAVMREQAQLIRISDEMNRERELNLAIRLMSGQDRRLTPEAVVCCAREDCLRAGCTGDFDPSSVRRK